MAATILMMNYRPSAAQAAAPAEQWRARAEQIAGMPGLAWKYWLRDEQDGSAGGVYLFDTANNASTAADRLTASLTDAGATDVTARIYSVDEELSGITRGLLPQPA